MLVVIVLNFTAFCRQDVVAGQVTILATSTTVDARARTRQSPNCTPRTSNWLWKNVMTSKSSFTIFSPIAAA
jgi:hypothetical protein